MYGSKVSRFEEVLLKLKSSKIISFHGELCILRPNIVLR